MGSVDVIGELARLVAEDAVSEGALAAMTQIDAAKLHSTLAERRPPPGTMVAAGREAFAPGDSMRVSILAGLLTEGTTVGDDERLTSILESLTGEMCLTPENIARLTGLDPADVERGLADPRSLALEAKYALALRTSFLVNAINLVRAVPRSS
ncbi:hypothetical protein LK09_17090 [Microbacterium mangrovi]|uniref:Uncharacterized protein n=1 Tax=Microbacterium mangrovi TaxID=1348253 RepID=A0A0B2A3A3_9MICO|nr:HTH domain-containing protein [Microbacterium mangrovi]KHK96058.1 hypothetical protein LK09_17090 [Microbacterium mangrovi]